MSPLQQESGDQGTVRLEGELTLPRAADLRSLLIRALVNADTVTIRFGDLEAADLSCLQLLCSVHRSAVRLKKTVLLDGTIPARFRETIEAAGFTRVVGCTFDSEKSCLWAALGARHG